MSRIPEKPACLNWLYRQRITGLHSCGDLLRRAAQEALQKDAIDAEAFATANDRAFWNYLQRENARLRDLGISVAFAASDSLTRVLDCLPLPADSKPEEWHHALKLRLRPTFLKTIDGLSDREYEALGCAVVEAMGASKVHLTPRSTEGGVDFYAAISQKGTAHLLGSPTSPIRVVGQSKLYRHSFGAPGFKEFMQTLSEVRYQSEVKTERAIPAWFRATRGPIIGMVFAHSGFQSGAESRARSHGIVIAESLELA